MSQIILDVDKKDMNTVLTILNNLKAGLIKNISSDGKKIAKPLPTSTSKYLSRDAYKQKLQKK